MAELPVRATALSGVVFDACPLPTFVCDAESMRVVAANLAAEERYAYSIDSFESLRMADLVDPQDAPRLIGRRELPDGETVTLHRHRHRRKDGTVFPVQTASREFRVAGSRYLMVVVTELSELRALDAENRFVEKMEALSRLGGGIAHTFNNLLTGILATTDLVLANRALASPVRQDVRAIHESAQRAAAITRQLMAFSGSQSLSVRETNVNQLIEQLTPLLQNVVPANVTLRFQLRSTGAAELDPAHLEQVILNLVLNGVEAMPDGGMLTLATEDRQDLVAISVGDTGDGIDEVTLARLFEPFHSTKGPAAGRGLGLASVWGTVRQMGGSIDIEGAHPGTRVRMFFRRIIAPIELVFVSVPAEPDVTGGEVILVVEDEPSVRAPICRTLRNLGYFVLEADNGEHALRVMQEHHSPVHLVVSDIMMPEMDGAQLVALLHSWYPAMRVLFVSGYSEEYLAARGGGVSGCSFLAKPFSMDALSRRVRELLDAEWSGDVDAPTT